MGIQHTRKGNSPERGGMVSCQSDIARQGMSSTGLTTKKSDLVFECCVYYARLLELRCK